MRKQRLPKEFYTDVKPTDTRIFCFWYSDALKKHQVQTIKEAREFVARATERNVAAFASAYVEEVSENQVFVCSFKGILNKYESTDWVNLEISGANYKLIHFPEKKANGEAVARDLEQWSKKEYGCKYDSAVYHVSWFNTSKNRFEEKVFTSYQDADAAFDVKRQEDQPVRLTEYDTDNHRIHEIKAARQHWHIGMGTYLEQLACRSLPIGEIPYAFSNQYLSDRLDVDGKYGYLKFIVAWDEYVIQISRSMMGPNLVDISIDQNTPDHKLIKFIRVDDNPILNPWIARIERQW